MDILKFLPEDLKRDLLDGMVDFLVNQAERIAGDEIARIIGKLSSQAAFQRAFGKAMESAVERLRAEYTAQDEDLVAAITSDSTFWQSKDVRQCLMVLIRRPGAWLMNEWDTVVQHFAGVLPQRLNRERVDKAVTFFLRCVVEELWTLPGAKEIRDIYSLQFQKIGAEAARQQVALLEAQLQATAQLSTDVRQALLQLAATLEQRLLLTPSLQPVLLYARPYHNLPQPDYILFVGRQKELDWLRRRLAAGDRTWQLVIVGIGGVGKSTLALAIANEYRERYQELPPEDRFEALIWISAKEEVLTIKGREKSALSGLFLRTLEDMYTMIAQTLEREDITRALPGVQDHLVQKALGAQRTLLIVDNLESVTDERVRTFLRNLPAPTKCILTSREWVDEAAVLRLRGLPLEEAEKMIFEEATARDVSLNAGQRQRLFERTAGLPLPIKLSAARVASGETFGQVMRWLGNATGDLPVYCVEGQVNPARKRDPNAWKLLLACSLFDQEAGALREALGSTTSLSPADRDDALALLQQLSLLNRTEPERFWMLPMVQRYAGAQFTEAGTAALLTERWLDWLLVFTQCYGIDLDRGVGGVGSGLESTQCYSIDLDLHGEHARTVSSEYAHLLGAIRWCREHERWETLLQLAEGVWFHPYLVGLFGELREILEAAVQACRLLRDEQREGRFLRRFGQLFRVQGQYEKALTVYLKRAEEIARRYEDDAELGRTFHVCSDILSEQNNLLQAEQLVRTNLEIGERLNDLELKALAAYTFSVLESKKLHFAEALEWLDRGEKWCRELGLARGLAWMMYCRGATLIQQGNIPAAEPFLMQSLSMATSWSERRLIALNEYNLARVYLDTSQFLLAHQMAEEARDQCERLGLAEELAQVEELLRKFPGRAAS